MKKTASELIEYYKGWISKYPFVSIEDPFDQDDWDGYKAFMDAVGKDQQIVGDDLLVTNPTRLQRFVAEGQSDRFHHRSHRSGHHVAERWMGCHGFPPIRGDRGLLHRRPRRWLADWSDQDRRSVPF